MKKNLLGVIGFICITLFHILAMDFSVYSEVVDIDDIMVSFLCTLWLFYIFWNSIDGRDD